MENIILLALFTYPGAIADGVYTWLARDKSLYEQPDTAFRAARDFFLSALIAVFAMPRVIENADEMHTLADWVEAMQTNEVIWAYVLVSVICAIVLGILWYLVRRYPILWLQNALSSRNAGITQSSNSAVWSDIINSSGSVNIGRCAVVIKKKGKRVGAGLPYSLPLSIADEPAIALMCCEWVDYELSLGDKSERIRSHQCTYHDMKNGIEIEFYDAEPLWTMLDEYAKSH